MLKNKYGNITRWDKSVKVNYLNDLKKDEKLNAWWMLDFKAVEEKLDAMPISSDYASVSKIPYLVYSNSKDAGQVLLGDKNPEYSLRIDSIMSTFPKSKIVVMMRDPRDNVSSYLNVTFDLQNIAGLAQRYNLYTSAILKAKKKYGDQILLVKFEDLVTTPKNTMSEICNFLNVSYYPELLEFYKSSDNVFSFNQKIKSPFDKDNCYKWKHSEASDALQKVDLVCADLIEKLNYPKRRHSARLTLIDKWNILKAYLITKLEKQFFNLPYQVQTIILRKYREQTQILEDT